MQNIKITLSKELQMYFDKVKSTIKSGNDQVIQPLLEYIKTDNGIQQLAPYMSQFIAEQVMAMFVSQS